MVPKRGLRHEHHSHVAIPSISRASAGADFDPRIEPRIIRSDLAQIECPRGPSIKARAFRVFPGLGAVHIAEVHPSFPYGTVD